MGIITIKNFMLLSKIEICSFDLSSGTSIERQIQIQILQFQTDTKTNTDTSIQSSIQKQVLQFQC